MGRKIDSGIVLMLAILGFELAGRVPLSFSQSEKTGASPPVDRPIKEIDVQAKKYEFSPSKIEVPVHTLVRIHLTALDHEHGFEIDTVENSCVKFKPGEPATVEFYTEKTGQFEFTCCKYCGLGHRKMKGILIVK